ncbi:hypothetical protein KH5_09460 [Urechidicola sp. KH5]
MLKKLLFLFFTVIFIYETNAQEVYLAYANNNNCDNGSVEFEQNGTQDGKPQYESKDNNFSLWRSDILIPLGDPDDFVPQPSAPDIDFQIYWDADFDGATGRWLVFTPNFNVIAFSNTSDTPSVPLTGWVVENNWCGGGIVLTLWNNFVLQLNNQELAYEISLYPNPTNSIIYFKNLEEKTNAKISTVTGQVVKNKILDHSNNHLDIQDLTKGLYFVEIEGYKTIKFIKN